MRPLLTLAISAALLSACGGDASDKAGGKGEDERVLRMANANEETVELEAFADEVKRRSSGRLRIEFVNDYRSGDLDAEPGILADVRAGKVDLAWVGARAFKAEGVDAFDRLIAPFAVTDYDTEREVLTSPAAQEMLAAGDGAGVRGVALLPGPLRYLAMREPWSGPADLAGKRIGAPAGIGSESLEALGATPVVGRTSQGLEGLDGIEEHLSSFVGNFYGRVVPHVAAQPVWPRPLVVVAAPALWERLDEQDRELLAAAGRAAVGPSIERLERLDAEALPKLCAAGARFVPVDLEALRAAMGRTAIPDLRAAAAPSKLACPTAGAPTGGLPAGTYTFTLTPEDARTEKYGEEYPADRLPVVFRAVVTAGHLVLYETADGAADEEIGLEADYSVFRDRIDIDSGTIKGRWKVDGDGNLRFSDIEPEGGDTFVFETHPWRRVE